MGQKKIVLIKSLHKIFLKLQNQMKSLFIHAILLITYPILIKAEYIVYSKESIPNGQGLQPINNSLLYAEKIYTTLLKYSWPTCIAYYDEIKKDLVEIKEIGEEEFLRKKIQNINRSLDIIFIPTTFYELMSLNFLDNKPLESIDFDYDFRTELSYLSETNHINNCLDIYKKSHQRSNFIKTHQTINNIFVQLIQKMNLLNNYQSPIFSVKTFFQLINSSFKQKLLEKAKTKEKLHKLFLIISNKEYTAHTNNQYILLRGTIPHSTYLENERLISSLIHQNKQPYSISFGNSLFAGFIYDKGATVFDYACKDKHILQILSLDKIKYLKSISNYNNPHKMLRIAPIPTLIALHSEGEHFHSRSIAISHDEIQKIIGYGDFPWGRYQKNTFISCEDSLYDHAYKYSQLTENKKKCLIFSLDETIDKNVIADLYKNQKIHTKLIRSKL